MLMPNNDRVYRNFIKSVSNSKFTPLGETPPDPKKPVFIPSSPKSTGTKGDYCFYKGYFYDRKRVLSGEKKIKRKGVKGYV